MTTNLAGASPVDQPVRPQPPVGVSECCTCGYRCHTGQHGGHSCAQQLREELDVTDKLLAARDALLRSIPACAAHGDQCVPHAMEWVRDSIRLRELLPRLIAEAMYAGASVRDLDAVQEAQRLLGPNAKLSGCPAERTE